MDQVSVLINMCLMIQFCAIMLILIVGPMKSGKSLELIDHISKLAHSNKRTAIVQPTRNTRDPDIKSRVGTSMPGRKLGSLTEFDADKFDAIGIEEAFMLPLDDTNIIKRWLLDGKTVIVSTLDLSAMGNLTAFYSRLLRLGPEKVIHRQAICEVCRTADATFTQICLNGAPVIEGLPEVLVEDDGHDYTYRPTCRSCFFEPENEIDNIVD